MNRDKRIHRWFAAQGLRKRFSLFLSVALVFGALLPCSPSMAAEAAHALVAVHDHDGAGHGDAAHYCVVGDQCGDAASGHRANDADDTLTSLPFPIAAGPDGFYLAAALPETAVYTEYIATPSGRLTYLHTLRLRL